MPLVIPRPTKCALCTFEVAEWLAPSLAIPRNTTYISQMSTVLSKRAATYRGFDRNGSGAHCGVVFRRPLSTSTSIPNRRNRDQDTPRHKASQSVLSRPDDASKSYKSRSILHHDRRTSSAKSKYAVFEELVLEQFSIVISKDLNWSRNSGRALLKGWGVDSQADLQLQIRKFKGQISTSFELADTDGTIGKDDNPLYYRLRSAFLAGDVRGLNHEVRHAFLSSTVEVDFSKEELANHKRIADLRYPTEWFPATRAMQRTIHLHVGPTNSGKTYHALQRLEAAKTGVYAGPLRLLAHEVYTRFNAKGKPCALVTGEERRYPESLKVVMNSCTVEMVPLNTKVDVAVIDEIQMMGDSERGWAWTQAFLGVQAKEVHLCGELRTVPLIQELCAMMGEKLEIHRYERLSPLKTSRQHLGSLRNLQKRDAVIVFSRRGIHAMKSEIEEATQKRCAVVYGSLPPETRAQQANLFNDPNNDYDFLVASDAIGMGLNLAIKRVIFESTSKANGSGGFKALENFEIKQIGGRAGRYKTAQDAVKGALTDGAEDTENLPFQLSLPKVKSENTGYVTTLEKFDLDVVHKAMDTEVQPLRVAGIFPPTSVIHRFASYFPPRIPFSWIVLRLHELAYVSPRFQLCRLKDQIAIADVIQPCNLTINDRLIFMASPAPLTDAGMPQVVLEFAQCVADNSGGELLSMKSLYFEILDVDMEEYAGGVNEYLRQVETLHKALTLYLWLSYRFAGVFRSQSLAFHAKSLVEDRIDQCLNAVHWDSSMRTRKAKRREKMLAEEIRRFSEDAESQTEEDGGEHDQLLEEHGQEEDYTEGKELEKADALEDPLSSDVAQDEAQDEIKRLEQTLRLPSLASSEASDATSSNERGFPADEVARVIGHDPLWERVFQHKYHEPTGS